MSNNLPALISMGDMERMAQAVSKSGLFGMKTPEQAMALMLVAQAEGLHPATAAMEYDIIQGRPARKSSAMLSRFQQSGGKMRYTERTDTKVAAIFSHPQGGEIEIDWTMDRARAAGLTGKDNWKRWPRQMLSARVISEGVRAVFPGATGMFYEPGEVADMVDVTPPAKSRSNAHTVTPGTGQTVIPHDPATGEIFPPSDNIGPEPVAEVAQAPQTDESLRAEKFCNEIIAKIDGCDSAERIEQVMETNEQKLLRAKAANEEAWDAVIAAAGYRKRKLLGEV